MHITHFNQTISQNTVVKHEKFLRKQQSTLADIVESGEAKTPEAALATWNNEALLAEVSDAVSQFKKPKHVILVGIGGSSLGTEAVHAVLDNEKTAQLHILDTVAAHETAAVFRYLKGVKKPEQIVICVVSKSGKTLETIANAEIVLAHFEKQFGKKIFTQTIFIGDKKSPLKRKAKALGAHFVSIPEAISGRFSVGTAAGLVPLALLGHDIESFLSGLEDASAEPYDQLALEGAAQLHAYSQKKYTVHNFFVFDTRLVRLAKWCRQLYAESLAKDKSKTTSLFPTVATAVDLHSMGQLYFAKTHNVYTDFIAFPDTTTLSQIAKKPLFMNGLKNKELTTINAGIYEAVLEAYREAGLPYRETYFDESLTYSLGLFMGMRMREVIYSATLSEIDAFTQPNVELYKTLSRTNLNIK